MDLAALAGLHLYPWQEFVLQEAMRERRGGKWAAFEVCLVVPRQNGKGSILEALELAALFLADPNEPPPLILHSAHEFKTSAEHFRRVRDLIEGSEMLSKQVRIIRTAAGAEAVELHNGARLRFVTRTGGSGRGFSADLVVVDEAYNLTAESMAAVLPTMSARPNPQIWYTSSAGMASSEQLAHLRRRGKDGGDPSLVYLEWSAEDGASLDDRAAWRQANPSLGLRIPETFVVAERAALPDEQFGRERLGLWADTTDMPGWDYDLWISLAADPGVERGEAEPTFGVATAPDRSWSAIAVAWMVGSMPHVMLADYKRDANWVADRVTQLRQRWGGRVLVDVASRGLIAEAEEATVADQAEAHNAMYDATLAGGFRHGNEPALNTAVRGSTWKLTGDTRVLNRKGSLDISPVAAAALALWPLLGQPSESWAFFDE